MNQFTTVWGPIGLSAVLAVWFLVRFSWAGPSRAKTIVKTASVAGLAVAAVVAEGPLWLVVALSFGALGDFFLSREGVRPFLSGLIAFALAHLAYVLLVFSTGSPLSFGPLAVGVGVFGVVMAAVLVPRAGALRWAVLAYVGIICAMGAGTLSLPASYATAMWAAVLFMMSDTFIGLERFVWGGTNPLRRVSPYLIWATYWAAQLLFLFAFALERSL